MKNRRRKRLKKSARKSKNRKRGFVKSGAIVVLILVIFCIILFFKDQTYKQGVGKQSVPVIGEKPQINVSLLTPNEYSRPQIELKEIKGIVIHYTANPGSQAIQNRDYFEGLKDSKTTKASSHFIVGLQGEIVQCIPSTEISYASNRRNVDTLSIECCHEDESGEFNQATYDSMVALTAWLCGNFQIQVEEVVRHYDITGKNCPKYFVENQEEWEKFKLDIYAYLENYGQ